MKTKQHDRFDETTFCRFRKTADIEGIPQRQYLHRNDVKSNPHNALSWQAVVWD